MSAARHHSLKLQSAWPVQAANLPLARLLSRPFGRRRVGLPSVAPPSLAGLRSGATAFDPPWSRLHEDLVTHFEGHRNLYLRPDYPLLCLDIEPITHGRGYVVGYGRKNIRRVLVGEDATLILPRTREEMREMQADRAFAAY